MEWFIFSYKSVSNVLDNCIRGDVLEITITMINVM